MPNSRLILHTFASTIFLAQTTHTIGIEACFKNYDLTKF